VENRERCQQQYIQRRAQTQVQILRQYYSSLSIKETWVDEAQIMKIVTEVLRRGRTVLRMGDVALDRSTRWILRYTGSHLLLTL
jgi:hypothetical protein